MILARKQWEKQHMKQETETIRLRIHPLEEPQQTGNEGCGRLLHKGDGVWT